MVRVWYKTLPGRASWHNRSPCHRPPASPQYFNTPCPSPRVMFTEATHKRNLRTLLRCWFPHQLAPSILQPRAFPEKFPMGSFIWSRACHCASVTGHRLCSVGKVAEDCCVFEQPQPVQPGTVVLGRLASAQEKGTPCPRMFGEESNGLAPVNPQTYYICE